MNTNHLSTLTGCHYVLATLPIWATAIILYVLTAGVIFVARDKTEGLFYQTSYAAQFGDMALIGAFLIAATILHRNIILPEWICNPNFHIGTAILGLFVGIVWYLCDKPRYLGDQYHHLLIAPLIVYLAITLLPVILNFGSRAEKAWVAVFAVCWAALVAFDFQTNRLNQRFWLWRHGIRLKP